MKFAVHHYDDVRLLCDALRCLAEYCCLRVGESAHNRGRMCRENSAVNTLKRKACQSPRVTTTRAAAVSGVVRDLREGVSNCVVFAIHCADFLSPVLSSSFDLQFPSPL